ncbi:MAG: hypothetical protein JEY97_13655, partial [Bacteroidales bacterium]|nr:hypothetical protein [Bacteroidales bacterium]
MKVYNKNIEPLRFLISKYKFDIEKIETISSGLKYSAVFLKNGNIGVCANLGHKINTDKNTYLKYDLNNFSHRIVLNAYLNSLLNYSNNFQNSADIFDVVDFRKYKQIVMLGFFKPILKKFNHAGIPITIFDLSKKDIALTPLSEQKTILKKTDAVILTSTSIFNLSFINSINSTNNSCEIFLLGPSSIMTKEIFNYKNIKMIFGSTFEKFDKRILKIIQ